MADQKDLENISFKRKVSLKYFPIKIACKKYLCLNQNMTLTLDFTTNNVMRLILTGSPGAFKIYIDGVDTIKHIIYLVNIVKS